MNNIQQDTSTTIRKGEELDLQKLNTYLREHAPLVGEVLSVTQFTGGFSNLTYCLKSADREYVLRRPPFGANIKSAHDMGREFKVLSLLKPVYGKVPTPIAYCEDEAVLSARFYSLEGILVVILGAGGAP